MTIEDTYRFKFRWVDENGKPLAKRSLSGDFDGEMLSLDDQKISVFSITDLDREKKFISLAKIDSEGTASELLLLIVKGSAKQLERRIAVACSGARAAEHYQQLKQQGREHDFRQVVCPECHTTIDLTEMKITPQYCCTICDSLQTTAPERDEFDMIERSSAAKDEHKYKICGECGMYSKPRNFTIFYFYFLFIFYGYSSRSVHRCPACMRGEAWKMFFGNLPFIFGVPVALVQLFRAYGGADKKSVFAGLDHANLKARANQFSGAIAQYQVILKRRPQSAGVKYNIALAFLHDGDVVGAARMLEFALTDCANYYPAASLLADCYQQLGESEKLDALSRSWFPDNDDIVTGELV